MNWYKRAQSKRDYSEYREVAHPEDFYTGENEDYQVWLFKNGYLRMVN